MPWEGRHKTRGGLCLLLLLFMLLLVVVDGDKLACACTCAHVIKFVRFLPYSVCCCFFSTLLAGVSLRAFALPRGWIR
jgi:hypothetical protein